MLTIIIFILSAFGAWQLSKNSNRNANLFFLSANVLALIYFFSNQDTWSALKQLMFAGFALKGIENREFGNG